MSTDRDYYAVLGVLPGAPHDEVQRGFRQKILSAHPDRGGSARQMLAIKEAWEALRHPERRAAYDAAHGFDQKGRDAAGGGAGAPRTAASKTRRTGKRGAKKKAPPSPSLAQMAGSLFGWAFRTLLGESKPRKKRKTARPGVPIVRCGKCGQKLRVRMTAARIVCPKCKHAQAAR